VDGGSLSNITHLSFDCYGTLIDWETGIIQALKPLLNKHGVTCADEQVLELYARCESAEESETFRPYREILRSVTRRLALELGVNPAPQETEILEKSLENWPPFSDTVDALRRLKPRFKLVIISNVDNDLFLSTTRQLQVKFDNIITALELKAYKPAHVVFEKAQELMGIEKSQWLHCAQSLFHDIAPCNQLGISTAWVNRQSGRAGHGATPPADASPDFEFPDLSALADFLLSRG
jgi:2-haloacid dehalogenase